MLHETRILVLCPINSCTFASQYGIFSHGRNEGGYTEEKGRFKQTGKGA